MSGLGSGADGRRKMSCIRDYNCCIGCLKGRRPTIITPRNHLKREFSISPTRLSHGRSAADVSPAILLRPTYGSSFWTSIEVYETSRYHARVDRAGAYRRTHARTQIAAAYSTVRRPATRRGIRLIMPSVRIAATDAGTLAHSLHARRCFLFTGH